MTRYAYITVLYGTNIYITGALVLGYSLWRTKTKYDRIILVTPDVSDEYKSYLKNVYTKVISIDYMDVNPSIFYEETRFRDVFTKLQVLSLIEYDKIILFDLDMIVFKNLDHVFKLKAPAAVIKKRDLQYGERMPKWMICKEGKMVGSVNAGLMLLKPDLKELDQIKQDVIENKSLLKFRYPEQDYLSLRYCGNWYSLTFQYNYQFGLSERTARLNYSIDDIYVIHYSNPYKPWNHLMSDYKYRDKENEFINKHKAFYDMWNKSYEFVKQWYLRKNIVLPY